MSTPTAKPPADRLLALRRRTLATYRVHQCRTRRTLADATIVSIRRRLPLRYKRLLPNVPSVIDCTGCGQPWPCDAYTLANTVEPLALAVSDTLAACSELEAETRLLSPVHMSPYRDAARRIRSVTTYRLKNLPTVKENRA